MVNGQSVDVRASNAPCVFGEKLAIRILNMQQQIQRIGRLGMDADAEAQIQEWAENVTGTFVRPEAGRPPRCIPCFTSCERPTAA